ncbi:MAG: response regulator [Deltaproteobacteria bacterium]|jgi:two-component system response regulator RegA|nr:response regulator [Deltaproteobacteria bacterium]MBK9366339.1 response regulator [Deltaproteobacteria bacterium]MBK9644567.1 response regulator [Deltaproteobacteria bacterium]
MSELRPTLLVVDDDERLRERLQRALRDRGYEVRGAGSAKEALALARDETPEHALLDLRLPDGGGLPLLRELRELDPTINIVVLTGYGSIATALEAVRLGATHYLTKPADADQIVAALRRRELGAQDDPPPPPDVVPSLARAEHEHIERVLNDCGGNVTQAAKLLGLHRRSLQRKLSKYPPRR